MRKITALPVAIATASIIFAANAYATGDVANGAKVFRRCMACHTIKAGDANRIGPNLHGLFTRQAGKAPKFKYSEGVAKFDFKWDDEKLDKWLENPQKFSSGARMAFRVPNPKDRADVIAYLHDATK